MADGVMEWSARDGYREEVRQTCQRASLGTQLGTQLERAFDCGEYVVMVVACFVLWHKASTSSAMVVRVVVAHCLSCWYKSHP